MKITCSRSFLIKVNNSVHYNAQGIILIYGVIVEIFRKMAVNFNHGLCWKLLQLNTFI